MAYEIIYSSEIMLLLLWLIILLFLHKVNRNYFEIPLILGISQFVLVGGYVWDSSIGFGFGSDQLFLEIWLVVSFAFLLYGFRKFYSGLTKD